MGMIDEIYRILQPIRRQITHIVRKAILSAVDDSTNLQLIKIQLGSKDTKDRVERLQDYGFTSVPEPGAECLALFIGGSRDNGIILAVDSSEYRKKGLQPGDVAMYHKSGDFIHLSDIGVTISSSKPIHINGTENTIKSSGKITLEAPTVDVKAGTVKLSDSPLLSKLVKAEIIPILSAHVHSGGTLAGAFTGTPAPGIFTEALHATTKTKGA